MKKMVTTPSYSTDSTESPIELPIDRLEEAPPLGSAAQCAHRFRRSAILSLAISLGASSFWMASQTQEAIATELPLSETTSIEKPADNPSLIFSLEASTLKHEVKPGETLWQLSRNYQIEPEAIAHINQISLQTDLQVGQTLKIPNRDHQSSPRLEKLSSVELDNSLHNLKESRRKLRESLAALRSNQITEQPTVVAETPDSSYSESVTPPSAPSDGIDESSSLAIELNHPMSIVVNTPDTNVTYLQKQPTLIPLTEAAPTTGETMPDAGESPQTIPVEASPSQPQGEPTVTQQTPKLIAPHRQSVYQVQPGDTLKSIAQSHGISVATLTEANQIADPNLIEVNQSLLIPASSEDSIFPNQLPPVPQVEPTTAAGTTTAQRAIVATEPMQPTQMAQPPSTTIPVEEATQASTERLRADFAHLEQTEAPTNPLQVSVHIPINANVTQRVTPQPRNLEWDNDGRISSIARPRIVESRPTLNSQPAIVGTASIQVEPYIDNLRIPVGTTVDPELPSPTNPNQYLPETQPVFQGFIWPAKGVLSSGYGRRWGKMHRGIDIAAPVGTPVIAAASGEVVSSGWNSGGYGNLVKVQHADGSVTLYAHNSRLLVRRGQQIQQGQQIAAMGSTGYSTGPHLHFEVHPNGRGAVNPIAFLPKKEGR